ncbi:MAG: cell surface protein [Myxococcota bacterium]|nr:cell surface protein [Myxococcota bacterium]
MFIRLKKTDRCDRSSLLFISLSVCTAYGCGALEKDTTEDTAVAVSDTAVSDTATVEVTEDTAADTASNEEEQTEDSAIEEEEEPCEAPTYTPYPFIDSVVDYVPGEGAGFGQDAYPEIIYGPPMGAGENAGSLDVLSLGEGGHIIVSFRDIDIVDGEGADVIVFENTFIGWAEPAIVYASEDGETWHAWNCDMDTEEGCAGMTPVLSHPDNCIDATDPSVAGGDAFDLADLPIARARYIKIEDAALRGPGGFDLDAIAVVNLESRD